MNDRIQQNKQACIDSERMEVESGVVKLNIGGKRFATTVSTLTQHGDNFFSGLLSGRVPSTKVNDHYFIDRNGRYFEPILDYLRTGCWGLPSHLQNDEWLVLQEAEFYGVKPREFIHMSDQSIRRSMQEVAVPPPTPCGNYLRSICFLLQIPELNNIFYLKYRPMGMWVCWTSTPRQYALCRTSFPSTSGSSWRAVSHNSPHP
jgi:hypothetical protein